MTLWELCVRRPVFTVMLVSTPIVLGIASYLRLGVELFPNVDVPVVTITTTLRGAGVEEMETGVTKLIEEAINTVSGTDELRSTTKEGFSQVVVSFKLEKNGDIAAQEVDSKIRSILSNLPIGTDPPVYDKLSIGAAPIVAIAISGRRDFREITEIARKQIKEELETVPGVGNAVLVGGRTRAIQVIIDPDKLLKYDNLTVEDIRQALQRENQEQPGGRVDRRQSELVLRTLGRIDRTEDLAKLIVGNRNGQPIRIEDVGRVEDSVEEPRSLARLWSLAEQGRDGAGENAVSLVIQKRSGANTVTVVDAVKARLERIRETLPSDIRVEIIRDQSRFIRNSMDEVKIHLGMAVVLVALSVMLFLKDWRTTLIATLSIPTSLVGTFAFMYVMGFTINTFTMIGLILAVGIIVDDAVVVHENIFRFMEERGLSAYQAAIAATSEISLAVSATTLSLVVVFAPVAFMGGTVGRFFSCFGYVVAFSVLMSMFVSFTLTPMLCAYFLKPIHGPSSKSGWLWQAIENGYVALLAWSLRNRWVVVTIALGIFFSTPLLFGLVGKDFVPKDDQSEFEVSLTLPEGYSLERADQVMTEVERRIRSVRGITHTLMTVGDSSGRVAKGQGEVTKALIYCRLVDLSERKFTQKQAMAEARVILADYPDLRGGVQDVAAISAEGFKQCDVDFNICGPDLDILRERGGQVAEWMRNHGGFADVDMSLNVRKPELRLRPDRERLSDLGVSLSTVSSTANVLVGGVPVGKFKDKDEQYDVWLRADWAGRSDPDAIARLGVPSSSSAGVVKLGNVVRIEQSVGPNSIERLGRQRQVNVTANMQGISLSEGVDALRAYMAANPLPAGYRFEFLGDAKMLQESNDNFAIGFLLAAVFMYMILAAQFESFVHPISILAALPLTIPLALVSLLLLRTNLDLFAMLGLFMLFGIVKKNGILQIDATNQLRQQGMEREQAILEANRARLRPILMTTVMLVAAMVPMAMGDGPGAGTRASMAKVILGGQALSLILTLLITPVTYSLLDGMGAWFRPKVKPAEVA